jgi:hypothetical protein
MLKSFESALEWLSKLKDRKTQLNYLRRMSDVAGRHVSPYGKGGIAAMNSAIEAFPHIEKLVLLIQDQLKDNRSRGRPQSAATDLIKDIANIYQRHIGEPKTTIKGPFYEICAFTIQFVGLKVEDPSRAIATAVKKLRVHN